MPVIVKSSRRRKPKKALPEYYYAYVGSMYDEDIPAMIRALHRRGIQADRWTSSTGLCEFRIKASEVVKCPDLRIPAGSSGYHPDKGFPYITGTCEWPVLLKDTDNTYYLKTPDNPWVPIAPPPTRRRKRKDA